MIQHVHNGEHGHGSLVRSLVMEGPGLDKELERVLFQIVSGKIYIAQHAIISNVLVSGKNKMTMKNKRI